MSMFGREEPVKNRSSALQLSLSLVTLLLGVLLTFIPDLTVRTLCYVFGILLIGAGLIAIVYYFISKSWQRMDDYNFALGTLLLILGICGLIRIDAMAMQFQGYLGLLTLLLGIMELQNTVQLRVGHHSFWLPVAVFTALTLIGGVISLLNITPILDAVKYWIQIVGGVLGLASLGLTAYAVRHPVKIPGAPASASASATVTVIPAENAEQEDAP